MIKADHAKANVAVARQNTTNDYISRRIEEASAAGYHSVKAWMDSSKQEEVTTLLQESGYVVSVEQVDGPRLQLHIEW